MKEGLRTRFVVGPCREVCVPLKHCSPVPGSNLSVTALLHPCQQCGATRGDYYRNLSNLPPRKWDVIYTTKKSASTFILPGIKGIPSQLTHCSSPVQLSRGWGSKELADFASCHWCYMRLDTERLVSLATGDAGLAQA